MTFSRRIAPFVETEFAAASRLIDQGEMKKAFAHLEDAHVLGQRSTKWHVLAHWKMLFLALRSNDFREAVGQLIRLIGAATKTIVGLVPTGNTGGTNVSPFRPMKLSEKNAEILASVERQNG